MVGGPSLCVKLDWMMAAWWAGLVSLHSLHLCVKLDWMIAAWWAGLAQNAVVLHLT